MTLDDRPWWAKQGYLDGREIGGGLWLCLAQMIYTQRVMVCFPYPGYVCEFYCYENPNLARQAFDTWDGVSEMPVLGWTRHHA